MKKIYTTPESETTYVKVQNILNLSTGEPTSVTGPIVADGKVRFDVSNSIFEDDQVQW